MFDIDKIQPINILFIGFIIKTLYNAYVVIIDKQYKTTLGILLIDLILTVILVFGLCFTNNPNIYDYSNGIENMRRFNIETITAVILMVLFSVRWYLQTEKFQKYKKY